MAEDSHDVLTRQEAAALERGGLDLTVWDLVENDPLARTASEYGALLKDSLTTRETAQRLGVHPSRIRQRLTAQPPTLYGIRLGDGSWRVLSFQLDGDQLLPGIDEVVAEFARELHPLSVHRWFTMRNVDLLVEDPALPGELLGEQLSPRDWLLNGLSPKVAANLARDL